MDDIALIQYLTSSDDFAPEVIVTSSMIVATYYRMTIEIASILSIEKATNREFSIRKNEFKFPRKTF